MLSVLMNVGTAVIDAEEIFYICNHDLDQLRLTISKMIQDIK